MRVVTLLLAAGFFGGAVELFLLRFSGGDVYPEYSSLRADPFGTMALYESLASLPGATATRHLKPFEVLDGKGGAVFYAGADPWMFRIAGQKQLEEFESVLHNGTRLIVVFEPEGPPPKLEKESETKPGPPPPAPAIEQSWGVRLAIAEPKKSATAEDDERDGSPRETLLYFDRLDKSWRTLREDAGRATVIMRPLGSGSIALVANGYLLTNEALLEQRDSELIASLIDGVAPRFTFDENHFGIEETGSIVALGRKYNLHGFAAGLLLLAILFIWANSSSFIPASDAVESDVLGRSAASGFVNMLRRGISPGSLMKACVEEWRKSLALGSHYPDEKRKRVEAAAAASGRDPLDDYLEISRILAERNIG
jgi:hypothetical protein